MGDVAMALPVVYALARTYPRDEFVLLTQPLLSGLVVSPPPNLEVMVIDIRHEERHLWSVLRYAYRLREEEFDGLIDLHDVLRTKVLRWTLRLCGWVRTTALHKPRQGRRQLLKRGRSAVTLPSMQSLYLDTVRRAGFDLSSEDVQPLSIPHAAERVAYLWGAHPALPIVGVAPYASTESKTYDLTLMERVVEILSQRGDCIICLLSGRGAEAQALAQWATNYPRVRAFAGELDLADELTLISHMACVVSMDSANGHFAALVGTPAITVWCATDPAAGFAPIGQQTEDSLHSTSLDCRPCSIFGQVHQCQLGDMPCRRSVSPDQIVRRVVAHLPPSITQQD